VHCNKIRKIRRSQALILQTKKFTGKKARICGLKSKTYEVLEETVPIYCIAAKISTSMTKKDHYFLFAKIKDSSKQTSCFKHTHCRQHNNYICDNNVKNVKCLLAFI
jgi:hypothetical protein